jgi:dTDP-4-dehydrorhamnose 3,5-epimerase
MDLRAVKAPLEGLLIVETVAFHDSRGYLTEGYHEAKYRDLGITCRFVQDNQSYSKKGVLRGLHAQLKNPQAKLVQVVSGEIFDVTVDARPESPTFGKWFGIRLSEENKKQLFIPAGFLHGFCVLSDETFVQYKNSDVYVPNDQLGVFWNDPDLAIDWPVREPLLSPKDAANIPWAQAVTKLRTR